MGSKDLYSILAIPFTASAAEIRAAYLRKSLETHPDKAGGCDAAFREVKDAYEVLSQEDKRRTYDRLQGFSFSAHTSSFSSSSMPGSPFSFSSSSTFSTGSFPGSSSSGSSTGWRHPRPPSDDPRSRPPKRPSFSSAAFGSASSSFGRRETEERWKRPRKTSPCCGEKDAAPKDKSKSSAVIEEKDGEMFEFSWR